MTALRAIDVAPPLIREHRDEQQLTETWNELDAWLDGRMIHSSSFLDDDETAQHIGYAAQVKHRARLEAYAEVRAKIAHLVAAERDEREQVAAEDSVEARFRDEYGPDAPKLAVYQAEGR